MSEVVMSNKEGEAMGGTTVKVRTGYETKCAYAEGAANDRELQGSARSRYVSAHMDGQQAAEERIARLLESPPAPQEVAAGVESQLGEHEQWARGEGTARQKASRHMGDHDD